MVVDGPQCKIFDKTWKNRTVNSFSESAGQMDNAPIVDVAVAYDCTSKSKTYGHLMHKSLYIQELYVNLIPPFIMREAGVIVEECPKSQSIKP